MAHEDTAAHVHVCDVPINQVKSSLIINFAAKMAE